MNGCDQIKPAASAIMRAMVRAGIGNDLPACVNALAVCVGSLALASDVPDAVMRDFNTAVWSVIRASGDSEMVDS